MVAADQWGQSTVAVDQEEEEDEEQDAMRKKQRKSEKEDRESFGCAMATVRSEIGFLSTW